MALKIIS